MIRKLENNSNISFKGYKGADNYGTVENREALKYRVKITPQQIDEMVQKAKTTDEGIVRVYNLVNSETKNINEAMRSLDVIVKHYLSTAKHRFEEIGQKRPYGSKIPIFGIIPDAVSKKTGGFINRIQGYTNDLIDDFSKIIDDYFHSSINEMITKYRVADNHLRDGIEFVDTIQGESQNRKIVKESLSNKRKSIDSRYNRLENNLRDLNKTVTDIANNVLKRQAKKQNTRITIKALIKIATAGHG